VLLRQLHAVAAKRTLRIVEEEYFVLPPVREINSSRALNKIPRSDLLCSAAIQAMPVEDLELIKPEPIRGVWDTAPVPLSSRTLK